VEIFHRTLNQVKSEEFKNANYKLQIAKLSVGVSQAGREMQNGASELWHFGTLALRNFGTLEIRN
jgi:hypothetical protein